jgi:hypothetical protein
MLKQNEQNNKKITSTMNPLIKTSANVLTVFIGLIASGYEFSYDKELAERIRTVKWDDLAVEYFRKARTSYCDVYPYWPRGAMLVSASLNLDKSKRYEYNDFNSLKKSLANYSNIDPKEIGEETELWLLQLPTYYRLIRENAEFNNFWVEYLKKTESVADQFTEAIYEAKNKVVSRFKISGIELPEIGVMPNILGFNGDFERIDGVIYVVCAQPDTSLVIHEYLHNIFEQGLKNMIDRIKEYSYLLNPVFEKMFLYKYAWAKDASSWCRVFEESLVMAATIWVNQSNENEAKIQSMKREDEGFSYVPVLLEQLNNNWCGTKEFPKFINCCLQACEYKYNYLTVGMPQI